MQISIYSVFISSKSGGQSCQLARGIDKLIEMVSDDFVIIPSRIVKIGQPRNPGENHSLENENGDWATLTYLGEVSDVVQQIAPNYCSKTISVIQEQSEWEPNEPQAFSDENVANEKFIEKVNKITGSDCESLTDATETMEDYMGPDTVRTYSVTIDETI